MQRDSEEKMDSLRILRVLRSTSWTGMQRDPPKGVFAVFAVFAFKRRGQECSVTAKKRWILCGFCAFCVQRRGQECSVTMTNGEVRS
jgi:hypothetical protein